MTSEHDLEPTTRADGSPTLPARGYSWAPFEEGNMAHFRHGARSERAIAERAEQVHAELLTYAPYLNEDRFIPAVSRYLEVAAREALLHAHIVAISADKGPGAVASRVWEQATAASRLAAKLGSDLGLDPIGHARIRALSVGADVGQEGLARLAEKGRVIRERREAEFKAIDAKETDDEPQN